METGEVSAPELPVAPKETGSAGENPEQAKQPAKEQAKPQHETRRRVAHRARRAKAARVPQRPLNLFEALFGGQQYRNPQASGTQQAAQGQYQGQYQQPSYNAQSAQGQYQQPAYDYMLQAPTEIYPVLRQQSY